MAELIPIFSGIVTILFSIGFYWGLQQVKESSEELHP